MNLIRINKDKFGRNREELMAHLSGLGIQTRPVWHPNHLQKPYLDCQTYKIERVDKLVETSLCLPSSSQLSDEDIAKIISALNG